jgi:hypothetical protein
MVPPLEGLVSGGTWTGIIQEETTMCRNIKRLRRPHEEPTEQELHDAALQFVRKISGFNVPSRANEAAFNEAVRDVAAAGGRLFGSLRVRGAALSLEG